MQEIKRSGLLEQHCSVFGAPQRSQLRWISSGRNLMGHGFGLLVCLPEGWTSVEVQTWF